MSYIDCSSATAATNAQMVEHPRKAVENVDIGRDGKLFIRLTLAKRLPTFVSNLHSRNL